MFYSYPCELACEMLFLLKIDHRLTSFTRSFSCLLCLYSINNNFFLCIFSFVLFPAFFSMQHQISSVLQKHFLTLSPTFFLPREECAQCLPLLILCHLEPLCNSDPHRDDRQRYKYCSLPKTYTYFLIF